MVSPQLGLFVDYMENVCKLWVFKRVYNEEWMRAVCLSGWYCDAITGVMVFVGDETVFMLEQDATTKQVAIVVAKGTVDFWLWMNTYLPAGYQVPYYSARITFADNHMAYVFACHVVRTLNRCTRAAYKIQRAFRRAISNPEYAMCRSRLMRELEEM